jgi:hypothetical protein
MRVLLLTSDPAFPSALWSATAIDRRDPNLIPLTTDPKRSSQLNDVDELEDYHHVVADGATVYVGRFKLQNTTDAFGNHLASPSINTAIASVAPSSGDSTVASTADAAGASPTDCTTCD